MYDINNTVMPKLEIVPFFSNNDYYTREDDKLFMVLSKIELYKKKNLDIMLTVRICQKNCISYNTFARKA